MEPEGITVEPSRRGHRRTIRLRRGIQTSALRINNQVWDEALETFWRQKFTFATPPTVFNFVPTANQADLPMLWSSVKHVKDIVLLPNSSVPTAASGSHSACGALESISTDTPGR